jgi:hypothetical protein
MDIAEKLKARAPDGRTQGFLLTCGPKSRRFSAHSPLLRPGRQRWTMTDYCTTTVRVAREARKTGPPDGSGGGQM